MISPREARKFFSPTSFSYQDGLLVLCTASSRCTRITPLSLATCPWLRKACVKAGLPDHQKCRPKKEGSTNEVCTLARRLRVRPATCTAIRHVAYTASHMHSYTACGVYGQPHAQLYINDCYSRLLRLTVLGSTGEYKHNRQLAAAPNQGVDLTKYTTQYTLRVQSGLAPQAWDSRS